MPFVKHAPTAAFLAQRRSMRTDRDPVSRANIDRLQSLGDWRSQPQAGASISQRSGSDNTPTAATPAAPVAPATETVLEESAAESDVSVDNADANDVSPAHTPAPVSPLDERRDTAMTADVSGASLSPPDVSADISANAVADDVSTAHTPPPGSRHVGRDELIAAYNASCARFAQPSNAGNDSLRPASLAADVPSADTVAPGFPLPGRINAPFNDGNASLRPSSLADDGPSAATLALPPRRHARIDALVEHLFAYVKSRKYQAASDALYLLRQEARRAYSSYQQDELETIAEAVHGPIPRYVMTRTLRVYAQLLDHWAWGQAAAQKAKQLFVESPAGPIRVRSSRAPTAVAAVTSCCSETPCRFVDANGTLLPPSAQTAACWNSIPNVLLPRPRLWTFVGGRKVSRFLPRAFAPEEAGATADKGTKPSFPAYGPMPFGLPGLGPEWVREQLYGPLPCEHASA